MDDTGTERIWPALLGGRRLDDGVFAQAYASISPTRRALLKSCIASLYAMRPGTAVRDRQSVDGYGPAGSVLFRQAPLAWTLVVTDGAFASPARLLAACLPALCARIPHVAVLRAGAGSPWPLPLALALELAGVEDVFDAPGLDATGSEREALCADLRNRLGPGLVVDLGAKPFLSPGDAAQDVFRPGAGRGLGAYAPEGTHWDFETLAFAHPDRPIEVYGPGYDGRPGCAAMPGGFEDMLAKGYEAVYAPAPLAAKALRRVPLVLTPGREAFWFWPGLVPERFLDRRAALFDANVSPEDPERP